LTEARAAGAAWIRRAGENEPVAASGPLPAGEDPAPDLAFPLSPGPPSPLTLYLRARGAEDFDPHESELLGEVAAEIAHGLTPPTEAEAPTGPEAGPAASDPVQPEGQAPSGHDRLTRTVFEAAHDALMITDPTGRIIEVNPAFTEQTGYGREEALGTDPGSLLDSHEHRPGFFEEIFAEVEAQGFWEGTIQNRRKDGSTVIHRETIARVCDGRHHTTHYVATMADVTPIKEAEQRARHEREITEAVMDSLPGVFFFLDRDGYNRRCNRRAAEYAGTDPETCCQRPVPATSFFDPADRPTIERHIATGFTHQHGLELETELVSRDGGRTPILFNATPVEIGGEQFLCGQGIDIRQRKSLEDDLRVLARTDPLTGACNRSGFEQRLQTRLAEARRYEVPFAVAMVDLDHFKELNDSHGHQTGDRLLEALVADLHGRTREADTICRWGGEEFMVLLPHTTLEGARQWADRLRAEVGSGPLVEGLPPVTVSIGLTDHRSGDEKDHLIQRVDSAMYTAKQAGRNQVHPL
jgi:diguanylate cyclase (GGDEF)-like protein/PAS domain S-box-containing protein